METLIFLSAFSYYYFPNFTMGQLSDFFKNILATFGKYGGEVPADTALVRQG
jgi:hypothetical protein